MSSTASSSKQPEKVDLKKNESKAKEIYQGFNRLRNEQRSVATQISNLEMDLNEHKVVVEQLKHIEPTRKCFRMIGGVLTERTVAGVLPILESNIEKLAKVIEAFNEGLAEKGKELITYKEKHGIKFENEYSEESALAETSTESTTASSSKPILVAN